MAPKRNTVPTIFSLLMRVWLSAALLGNNLEARELLRGGPSPTGTPATTPAAGSGTVPATTAPAVVSPSARLTRTKDVLTAVSQMQLAARNLASGLAKDASGNLIAAPTKLRSDLKDVLDNSWKKINGLVPSSVAPVGATLPDQATVAADNSTTVNVTQTQQQAVLTWDTFNIGRTTTLNFDQKAGGTNAGQWTVFNYVRDPSGAPSQILGSIKTLGLPDAKGNPQVGGQVYVLNTNGIIFGGSSQVNTHALVASSLPINYNLIKQGVLNNPDAQFLFSTLKQDAGKSTPAFDPATAGPDGLAPKQNSLTSDGSYGDVVVQPGARLTAPTNADHVGGRIALIGPNVTNAGTISTEDGQTILAAGLQVGLGAHNGNDATLRGLDVYVGAVNDPALKLTNTASNAGQEFYTTASGAALQDDAVKYVNTTGNNPNQLAVLGEIDALRGDVFITGQAVNQNGVIASNTSVAYNGRVDLVAAYHAVPNPVYGSLENYPTVGLLPFVYQSHVENDILAGAPVANSGRITLGQDSVLQILPDTASTDRTVGDLALPSQVNIQGQAVYFASNSTLLAPGASVPLSKPALGVDGSALGAGVAIRAGNWLFYGDALYSFVHSDDSQQIYLDSSTKNGVTKSALIDVAGMQGESESVTAPVTENIVLVQLRGSELANSPLQRDGALRGQTVQVDVRQHGPWDKDLNGGLGGYTWVGTPLADTSGWVGLTTHSVGELSINGGSVALKAGGAVVVQDKASINVSGGYIDFKGGVTQTTKVVSNGHTYDISLATPDRVYTDDHHHGSEMGRHDDVFKSARAGDQ